MKPLVTKLAPYLDHIRALPFIREVEVAVLEPAVVLLRTPTAEYRFRIALKRTHLTRTLVDGWVSPVGRAKVADWILFAPYVGRPMGRYLKELGVNYFDTAGNCRLQVGQEHTAWIEGQRPPATGGGRGVGVAGFQVLFTVLARPDLLNVTVRNLADLAGVGRNAAAQTVNRLVEEGIVAGVRGQRRLLDRQGLMDRWLTGYGTLVRPRIMVGRFRTPDANPEEMERRIETVLGAEERWAWGGGAAAMRLTKFYRGPKTIVHVERWQQCWARELRALQAQDGPLIILGTPGRVGLEGALPGTAHPLLVYTELLAGGDPREIEAAEEIQRSYLQG